MTFFTISAGIAAGLSPAVFTLFAFGSTSDLIIIICFFVCLAVSTALMQSYDMVKYRTKRITSITAYVAVQLLLFLNPRIYGNAFIMMNPEYYYEYGGPNAGSGLALLIGDIPAAIVILLVACGLSFLISKKRSK